MWTSWYWYHEFLKKNIKKLIYEKAGNFVGSFNWKAYLGKEIYLAFLYFAKYQDSLSNSTIKLYSCYVLFTVFINLFNKCKYILKMKDKIKSEFVQS